jgi:hypothetical protein
MPKALFALFRRLLAKLETVLLSQLQPLLIPLLMPLHMFLPTLAQSWDLRVLMALFMFVTMLFLALSKPLLIVDFMVDTFPLTVLFILEN